MIVSFGCFLHHNVLSSAWQFVPGWQFLGVVVADHVDFVAVVTEQSPQVFEGDSPLSIIIETIGGELRDGMIVLRQFSTQVVRIADM